MRMLANTLHTLSCKLSRFLTIALFHYVAVVLVQAVVASLKFVSFPSFEAALRTVLLQ